MKNTDEGAWRIIVENNFGSGWEHAGTYLYDSKKAFERQCKIREKACKAWNHYRFRFTTFEFNGHVWVQTKQVTNEALFRED